MSRYSTLFSQIEKYKPTSILEVGTWCGTTAKKMIELAQKYHPNNTIIYYGFDFFDDFKNLDLRKKENCNKTPANIKTTKERIKETCAKIHLIKGNTKETLAKFTPTELIDFVFIDGGHSLETIQSDWTNVQRYLHSKSVVIFDDYYEETAGVGCKALIDGLSLSSKWQVEFLAKDVFENPNIGKQTTWLVKVQFTS